MSVNNFLHLFLSLLSSQEQLDESRGKIEGARKEIKRLKSQMAELNQDLQDSKDVSCVKICAITWKPTSYSHLHVSLFKI